MFWLLAITISAYMRWSCAIICVYPVDKKAAGVSAEQPSWRLHTETRWRLTAITANSERSRGTLRPRRLGVLGRRERTGLVARIGRADGVAAGPVDLVYTHFETAHAAVLV